MYEGKLKRIKCISSDYNQAYILTRNTFLELGIATLLSIYFVMQDVTLYVIDRDALSSTSELTKHLIYIQSLDANIKVMILNEPCANARKTKRNSAILFQDASTDDVKSLLAYIHATSLEIEDVISYYEKCMKKQELTPSLAMVVAFLIKGLSVTQISNATGIPRKTLYGKLQRLSTNYNKKSLPHLIFHFVKHYPGSMSLS